MTWLLKIPVSSNLVFLCQERINFNFIKLKKVNKEWFKMHYIYFTETDIFRELNSHVSLVKETMSLNFHFPPCQWKQQDNNQRKEN